MLLNEIINEVGMTKRAVKYYEEKGLLSVDKDNNGYRNYTAQDVETLKKISVYRKLGISIKDIQSLLETGDKSILLRVYQDKVQEKVLKDSELEALKQFIDDGDADKANEALDYQTVENAIESLLPGKEWGDYFKSHFKPFLNVRLKTLEQKQALQNILEYCDETTLKVPFIMGIGAKMIGGIAQETRTADEMIAYYRDMSESEYERLKEKVWKGAKMKNGIMKYHPAFIAQRKMQKELQNKGYNDIFIPNLMVLSPTYAEYKKALDNVNDRMCRELGLYYDSNYNLVIKKDNSNTLLCGKKKYFLLIYPILIGIYFIFHQINAMHFHSLVPGDFNYSMIKEALYFVKMLSPFLLIYCIYKAELSHDTIINIMKSLILIIGLVIILSNIFVVSYGNYSDSIIKANFFEWFNNNSKYTYKDLASKGLFEYGNQISAILIMFLPFAIYLFAKKRTAINLITLIVDVFALTLLCTRVSVIGVFIVFIYTAFAYSFVYIMSKKRFNTKGVLPICVVLLVYSSLLPINPMFNRINERQTVIDTFKEEEKNYGEERDDK